MCGINGFYNFAEQSILSEENLIRAMNDSIKNRGPDGSGIWGSDDRKIFFGHQRLSILDLSVNGKQPMTSKKGSVITYNGEIYNFKALKKEISQTDFISKTDTEVLLSLYESCQEKFLDKLNGMFAFAIWDQAQEQLFLARDRVGIKPLYYTTKNGIFAFSSEIKSLLRLPWVRACLDEEAFYDFLTFGSLHPPFTMFQDIKKLHPGYKMIVDANGIRVNEPYWEIEYSNYDDSSQDELQTRIIDGLTESVKLRMISDVPVGAFLSGGVDSSAIVALMSQQTSIKVKTFSIGFENAPDYNELGFAKEISRKFGTEHNERLVSPKDIVDFLPKIVEIYDEPLIDATSIPIYFISQMARESGTYVILTGDGPDELFSGYRNWARFISLLPYLRLFQSFPRPIKKFATLSYKTFLGSSSPVYDILNRATKDQELFWGGARIFKESTKKLFLSSEYSDRMSKNQSYQKISSFKKLFNQIQKNGRRTSDIDWMTFLGLKDIIPNFYLYRGDRLGMANSIELRVPYLDHNFVNLALSVKGSLKFQNNEPKFIFKKALESILTKETLYRKKQGFCVPLREWLGGTILEYVEENLETFCKDTRLFNYETLNQQVREIKRGNQHFTNTLFTIYFLMSWFKKWLL